MRSPYLIIDESPEERRSQRPSGPGWKARGALVVLLVLALAPWAAMIGLVLYLTQ